MKRSTESTPGAEAVSIRSRGAVVLALGVTALLAVGFGAPHAEAAERASVGESEWVERCFDLGVGDTLRYSFTASAPVNFDLHFHSGDKTLYPVKKDGASDGRGAYTAREPQKYCLSWANPSPAVADITFDARAVKR